MEGAPAASYTPPERGGVARCATAGSGVPGQDVGLPGAEDAPAAMTENDLMTLCSGFVRGEMGGTAGGRAAG